MQEIIKAFNEVRDLPYHCPECLEEEDYRCWGKHRILLKRLLELGYKVRLRVCDFIWNEPKLPEEIKCLALREEYEGNFRKYEKFHKAFNRFFEGFRNK